MSELDKRVSNFIKEIQQSDGTEELEEFLSQVHNVAFEKYSSYNQAYLWVQLRDRDDIKTGKARYFHGYNTWRDKYGRQVEEDSDSFKVLAPQTAESVCPDCGNTPSYHSNDWIDCELAGSTHEDWDFNPHEEWDSGVINYKPISVFEYSQTNPIPDVEVWEPEERKEVTGNIQGFNTAVRDVIESFDIDISVFKQPGDVRGGSTGGNIFIMEDMDELTESSVLVHELAHELLHWDGCDIPQEQKEVEAECVAYAVCSYFNIETNSVEYVNHWDNDDVDTWDRLTLIQDTAKEIINCIEV
jgi:hypothetical protein